MHSDERDSVMCTCVASMLLTVSSHARPAGRSLQNSAGSHCSHTARQKTGEQPLWWAASARMVINICCGKCLCSMHACILSVVCKDTHQAHS